MVFNKLKHYNDYSFNINMNGHTLNSISKIKFLGVIIDCNLNWQEHIHSLSSQIASGVGIIGRLKYVLPKSVLRTLYFTLIYPHFTYCSTVWSCTRQSYLKRLFLLQKRAVRHICHCGPRDHTDILFKTLNLLKLQDIINLGTASITYRFIHNLLPDALSNFFTINSLIHNYNTRNPQLLLHTVNRTSPHSRLRYRATNLWNSLPKAISDRPSLKSFRYNLSNYYLNKY